MNNISKSYKIRRSDLYDNDVRFHNTRTIIYNNVMIYVRLLAKKLKSIPDETKNKIKELWLNPQKKRIRLQNLGADKQKSKGFVIDNNNVVDGLTRRINDWLENQVEKDKKVEPYLIEFFKTFVDHNDIKELVSKLAAHDKEKRCRCYNLKVKKMDPMTHGSKVHQEVYNAVRYALKLSGLSETKRKIPQKFNIDECTKSCLLKLLNSKLIPFTAEWPVFTSDGTGCATAFDLVCIDFNKNYEFKVIELKTGNVVKALKANKYISNHHIPYNQASVAAIQLLLTIYIGKQCYGNKYFNIVDDSEGECSFSNFCNIMYIKSWGSILLNIPKVICQNDKIEHLFRSIIFRRESLRDNLPNHKNAQSLLTSKGTVRKRRKQLTVGF